MGPLCCSCIVILYVEEAFEVQLEIKITTIYKTVANFPCILLLNRFLLLTSSYSVIKHFKDLLRVLCLIQTHY